MNPVIDIGLGARRALDPPGEGRVLAVYRRAAYLSMPGGLCALTAPSAPAGPLHVRCTALPPCRAGRPVRTDGRTLSGEDWQVALDAPTWTGQLPGAGLLADAITPAEAARRAPGLGGRGPGLTPAGDDVLAGLLLVARAAGGPGAEPQLLSTARQVRTTVVASAFLEWAARGQCIEPAHDALFSLSGPRAGPSTRACDRLAAVGASSGRALLTGIRFGLGTWTGGSSHISTIVDECLSL